MRLTLQDLYRWGFDRSTYRAFARTYRVACSQCEALCINGIPTHERGCPNLPHVCSECGSLYKTRAEANLCCQLE